MCALFTFSGVYRWPRNVSLWREREAREDDVVLLIGTVYDIHVMSLLLTELYAGMSGRRLGLARVVILIYHCSIPLCSLLDKMER